jgi:ADP-heptose:LPS heptosyltransferase
MDVLIVKLGALGDVVNTFPLVVNLKRGLNANIFWLIEPLSYQLVSEHACVDHAILFDKYNLRKALPEVMAQLRTKKFDIVLDLQRIVKSGIFCCLAKADRRIGFDKKRCKEFTWLFPFERIPASDPGAHMVYQYLEFARYLGIDNPEIRWEIPVKNVASHNLPKNYVVLNIGATKAANLWTAQGFAAVAENIMKKFGMKSVITGAQEDLLMAKNICSKDKGNIIDLVGKTSMLYLKEVLAGAKAVVSCDTGPMHLAVALEKEVVALFGPSDPKRTGPFKGRVIQKDVGCNPCNKRKCDDPICMESITPDDVIDALEDII